MSTIPSGYTPWLPRVSQIVESVFPFTWNARERFHYWLRDNGIEVEDYMREASEWGTLVHKALEDYLHWKRTRHKKYKNLIDWGVQFIKDSWLNCIATEDYIRTKDYQWTIDLVAEVDGEEWILDWKSYWLAKTKFQLPNTYKKPYDKLKKARLQLSLYAHAKWIKNIGVVELTEEGYHFHVLELIPIEEINKILIEYKYNYVDNI